MKYYLSKSHFGRMETFETKFMTFWESIERTIREKNFWTLLRDEILMAVLTNVFFHELMFVILQNVRNVFLVSAASFIRHLNYKISFEF